MGEKVAREGTRGDRAINEDAAGEGEGRVRKKRKGDCDQKTMLRIKDGTGNHSIIQY